jgi:hypothetical protein
MTNREFRELTEKRLKVIEDWHIPAGFKPYVKPEHPPFRVGDEVELHNIKSSHKWAEGKRGRITQLDNVGQYPMWVLVEGAPETNSFRRDEVRLYVPPKPEPKFKVGDFIRCNDCPAQVLRYGVLGDTDVEVCYFRYIGLHDSWMPDQCLERWEPKPGERVCVELTDGRSVIYGKYRGRINDGASIEMPHAVINFNGSEIARIIPDLGGEGKP